MFCLLSLSLFFLFSFSATFTGNHSLLLSRFLSSMTDRRRTLDKFRFLKRLILVHGRYSYNRTTFLSQYSFYKSLLICFIQIFFSFISGVSGTILFNSVSLMAYNVFYTSIPVLISTLDKDLSEGTIMQHPQILFYCQAGRLLNPNTFAGWFGRSLFHWTPDQINSSVDWTNPYLLEAYMSATNGPTTEEFENCRPSSSTTDSNYATENTIFSPSSGIYLQELEGCVTENNHNDQYYYDLGMNCGTETGSALGLSLLN